MPQPNKRSRTLRRVFRKTPGRRTVLHYVSRKPDAAICGSCGAKLKGMFREKTSKVRKAATSKKRPTRPYAGVLCTRCMRRKIIEGARA